jgi:small-conductance mechanosensitive channel
MNIIQPTILEWTEVGLLALAAVLFTCGLLPMLRSYRALFWGSSALVLITAVFPRQGNPLGQYLFVGTAGVPRIPFDLFGIAWWILGAWLVKSLLDLILRRTIFPDDNEPHARRLFADLASALIYVVAFVGIMDTVLKQPIAAVLATSGVLAIVLGLALQNTLADVFSGLAINIERGAGDWITLTDGIEGEVIEINWRATRIKSPSNDMIVIPNSFVAKAVVTNHRRLNVPHICTLEISIDHRVSPTRVIAALQAAASSSPGIAAGSTATAFACRFTDSLVTYELDVSIDDFTLIGSIRSEVVRRVVEAFRSMDVRIGTAAMAVQIVQPRPDPPDVDLLVPPPAKTGPSHL